MFFGVSPLQTFHVAISLLAIAVGVWVLFGMMSNRRMSGATALFLTTTVITTLTGFLFPIGQFTPALGVGIISTAVLAICLWARYRGGLQGRWRGAYVVTAVLALYLNCFVLVVQLFLKVPALNALAPGGTEPPFLIAQAVTLVLFVFAGLRAFKRFHPADLSVEQALKSA